MKKLWARIGMELVVTDEEYESIQEKAMGEDYCFDEDSELAKRFVSDGKLSGESYVPDDCLDEWKDPGTVFSDDETRTVLSVFNELMKMTYDELNKFLGSITIKETSTLYTKIRYRNYCRRHNIRFEDMTDDDFENAALEEIDEYYRNHVTNEWSD